MILDSWETVVYTCVFLLPGYIVSKFIGFGFPVSRSTDGKRLLSWLLYSVVVNAVCFPLYGCIHDAVAANKAIFLFLIVCVAVVASLIIAGVVVFVQRKQPLKKVFELIGGEYINPIATSWEYCFSKREETYVIVTMDEGKRVYGLYGCKSYASSDMDNCDLYLEKTYSINKECEWVENEGNRGVLISKDRILCVEFLEGRKQHESQKDR